MSYISQRGRIDNNNSTATPLNVGQTFVGATTDVSSYPAVVVAVRTDTACTLYVEFSPNGTNWDSSIVYSVAANVNEVHRLTVTRRYFRIRILNNSEANQTFLRAQVTLGTQEALTTSLSGNIQSDQDTLVTRSVIAGSTDSGVYKYVPITQEGHLEVAIHDPVMPFGSIHTEKFSTIFQADAVYGINPSQVKTTTSAGGSAFAANNFFICSTGNVLGGFGTIQSRRRLRYRPGQGMVARYTGIWSQPVSNSISVAGVGSGESGFYFGMSGTTFGILQAINGVRQIVTLNVATASTATNNYNVVLNGVTFNVPATNNGSTLRTAYEIASGTYRGWDAEAVGSTVIFLSNDVGLKNGAFSLSQTGAGVPAAGTFSTTLSGRASDDTFIPQTEWNGDKLDGTGASGYVINPQKGNIFEIHITYLGFGPIKFKVFTVPEDGNNPVWTTVHTIKNPNTLTRTNVSQPSFPFTLAAYSAGSTTNVSLSCASFAGFVEGDMTLTGPRQTYEKVANNLVGSAAGTYYTLFTVRNDSVYRGRANQSVVQLVSIGVSHGDATPMVMYLIRNATLVGTPNFIQHSPDSCTLFDESATTCTITDKSQIIASLPVGADGTGIVSFSDIVTIQPGETVTLAARAVTGTSPWTIGSLNTREDQ